MKSARLYNYKILSGEYGRCLSNSEGALPSSLIIEMRLLCMKIQSGQKARTHAKSYLPTKTDKFYFVVDWKAKYFHKFSYNSARNRTELSHTMCYLKLFSEMRTPVERVFDMQDGTTSERELWMTNRKERDSLWPAFLFTDKFYTYNTFARRIKKMVDNEVRLIGTVRPNFVDVCSTKLV